MKTVYWDANVFHALFSAEPGRVDVCAKIGTAAKNGEVQIYTSSVTMIECVWLKGLPRLSKDHEAVIAKFFMHKFIRVINCDRAMAESARALLWQYEHLQPKDAIHVASAFFQQVEVLHSYDKDLLVLDGKIGTPAMKICAPDWVEPPQEPKLAI
jgi:predicted nucleic acid-binding protein